jgi:hypothetical protein
MVITVYLLGVAVSLLLLIAAWNKLGTNVCILGICLGILSCMTSWAAVIVLIAILTKKV